MHGARFCERRAVRAPEGASAGALEMGLPFRAAGGFALKQARGLSSRGCSENLVEVWGAGKRSRGALPIAPCVTVLLIVAFHPLFGGFHLPEILHAGLHATVGDRDLARRAALAFVNTVVVHVRDCLVLLVPVDRDSVQLELHAKPPLQRRVTPLLPRNYDFASVTDRLTSGRRDWRRRRDWRDRTIAGEGREQNQRVGAHSLPRWESTWITRGIPTYRMVPERRIDGGLGSRWSGWRIEANTAHSDGVQNAPKKGAACRSASAEHGDPPERNL